MNYRTASVALKHVFLNSLSWRRSLMFLCMLFAACTAYGKQRFLPEHPRLLFTEAETSEVKRLMETDPLAGELASYLKQQADSIMEAPQISGPGISRTALYQEEEKPIEGITMLEAECPFEKAEGKVTVQMSSRKL